MGANANAAYPPPHQEYYPSTNAFPPPPVDDYARGGGEYAQQEYPPYNPSDYPPPPGATPQPHERGNDRYDSDQGYQPANETYAGDNRRHRSDRRNRDPADVSPNSAAPGAVYDEQDPTSGGCRSPHHAYHPELREHKLTVHEADGLDNSRPKSVQFASEVETNSPEADRGSRDSARDRDESEDDRGDRRRGDDRDDRRRDDGRDDRTRDDADYDGYDGPSDGERKHRRRRRHRDRGENDRGVDDQSTPDDRDRRRRRSSRRRDSSVSSSETVDLPPRFDDRGNKRPERGEDPLADKIEDMLSGKGMAGGLFKRLTGDLLGGDNGDGRKKRR